MIFLKFKFQFEDNNWFFPQPMIEWICTNIMIFLCTYLCTSVLAHKYMFLSFQIPEIHSEFRFSVFYELDNFNIFSRPQHERFLVSLIIVVVVLLSCALLWIWCSSNDRLSIRVSSQHVSARVRTCQNVSLRVSTCQYVVRNWVIDKTFVKVVLDLLDNNGDIKLFFWSF